MERHFQRLPFNPENVLCQGVIERALRSAQEWGGGCLSYAREALEDDGWEIRPDQEPAFQALVGRMWRDLRWR